MYSIFSKPRLSRTSIVAFNQPPSVEVLVLSVVVGGWYRLVCYYLVTAGACRQELSVVVFGTCR